MSTRKTTQKMPRVVTDITESIVGGKRKRSRRMISATSTVRGPTQAELKASRKAARTDCDASPSGHTTANELEPEHQIDGAQTGSKKGHVCAFPLSYRGHKLISNLVDTQ